MFRTEEGWIKEYEDRQAFWVYPGNPACPHARLTGGEDSDLFFNSKPIIADKACLRRAASDLVEKFLLRGGDIEAVDCVVGPQTGATDLAEFISDEIGKRRGRPCRWASPKKVETEHGRMMFFVDPAHTVLCYDNVLLCEDVMSTGGSLELAGQAAVNAHGGVLLGFVLMLVNRSERRSLGGAEIVSLIHRPASKWKPDECPLCAQGSEAIRPKGTAEWARLTRRY